MDNKQHTTKNPYTGASTNVHNTGVKSSRDDSISHKVGDSIERLGEKVMKAGAQKLGRAIYNAGNKIEHMNDHKTTRNS